VHFPAVAERRAAPQTGDSGAEQPIAAPREQHGPVCCAAQHVCACERQPPGPREKLAKPGRKT
jgi:hypothetical protein